MYKRTINNVTFNTRSNVQAEITGYAVYQTTFIIDNEKFHYFGKQSFNTNPDMSYIGSGRKVREKLSEMKETDKVFKIVLAVFDSNDDALEFEHQSIMQARKDEINLLNISSGNTGGTVFGGMTDEQIKARNLKISASMQGHVLSAETRKKISDAKRGKIQSEETKQKIGSANKGRVIGTRSAETIEKMKQAQQARRLREAA